MLSIYIYHNILLDIHEVHEVRIKTINYQIFTLSVFIQQTQNTCITFVQRWANIVQMLYICFVFPWYRQCEWLMDCLLKSQSVFRVNERGEHPCFLDNVVWHGPLRSIRRRTANNIGSMSRGHWEALGWRWPCFRIEPPPPPSPRPPPLPPPPPPPPPPSRPLYHDQHHHHHNYYHHHHHYHYNNYNHHDKHHHHHYYHHHHHHHHHQYLHLHQHHHKHQNPMITTTTITTSSITIKNTTTITTITVTTTAFYHHRHHQH